VRHPLKNEIKVRVSANLNQRVQAVADCRELSVSDIVREALREYLAARASSPDVRPATESALSVVQGGVR
jgi:predicted transcriptional regulator